MTAVIDRTRIERRIDDWVERLEALYERVRRFARARPDAEELKILEGQVLQRLEYVMEQNDVPPRMLPTIAVLKGINRVSFVPSALWTIGANGRATVTTNRHQYMLADLNEEKEAPSDWRIATSRGSAIQLPFDETVFSQLLDHQELA